MDGELDGGVVVEEDGAGGRGQAWDYISSGE